MASHELQQTVRKPAKQNAKIRELGAILSQRRLYEMTKVPAFGVDPPTIFGKPSRRRSR
jgi:hypothetical protein